MINIDKQLIEEQLKNDRENGFTFIQRSLSNKLLDNLFTKYRVIEACQNFYDNEPDFEEELYDMYRDYADLKSTGLALCNVITNIENIEDEKESFTYSKLNHTRKELKEAYDKVTSMYAEYEPLRIKRCNWQEPYFKGNWEMSQKYVDDMSRDTLKQFKKLWASKKGRIYYAKKDDEVRIYLYGRDILFEDWWFIFKRK